MADVVAGLLLPMMGTTLPIRPSIAAGTTHFPQDLPHSGRGPESVTRLALCQVGSQRRCSMSFPKASLVVLGMAASMAVGVWMAPYVTGTRATPTVDLAAVDSAPEAAPVATAPARETRTPTETTVTARLASITPDTPALHARLQPILARGTKVELAASGFDSAEQFATVAYLAHNTGVPFVLLKHRLLNEGRSLSDAVTLSKPDLNADLEVSRAQAEARAELWSVG